MTRLVFSVKVKNPNDFDIHVAHIAMKFHVMDYLLTSEYWSNIEVLASHQIKSMQIPVKIDLLNAITLLPSLMSENMVPYKISGIVKLKNYSKELPFIYKGEFKSSQMKNVMLNNKVAEPMRSFYRF